MSKNYDFVLSFIHAYNNAHFLLPNRNPLYSGANTGVAKCKKITLPPPHTNPIPVFAHFCTRTLNFDREL